MRSIAVVPCNKELTIHWNLALFLMAAREYF